MKIIQRLKKAIFPENNIVLINDDLSLSDCIGEAIRKLDFEPKLKIKKMYCGSFFPWAIIENGCYYINANKKTERFDIEILGFQIAFGSVRMRAQKENPNMLLFAPDFLTGIPLIDQKISEVYLDNFDNKKETDRAISSWIAVRFYIEDCCSIEEYAKLTRFGANEFIKFKVLRKERRIVTE